MVIKLPEVSLQNSLQNVRVVVVSVGNQPRGLHTCVGRLSKSSALHHHTLSTRRRRQRELGNWARIWKRFGPHGAFLFGVTENISRWVFSWKGDTQRRSGLPLWNTPRLVSHKQTVAEVALRNFWRLFPVLKFALECWIGEKRCVQDNVSRRLLSSWHRLLIYLGGDNGRTTYQRMERTLQDHTWARRFFLCSCTAPWDQHQALPNFSSAGVFSHLIDNICVFFLWDRVSEILQFYWWWFLAPPPHSCMESQVCDGGIPLYLVRAHSCHTGSPSPRAVPSFLSCSSCKLLPGNCPTELFPKHSPMSATRTTTGGVSAFFSAKFPGFRNWGALHAGQCRHHTQPDARKRALSLVFAPQRLIIKCAHMSSVRTAH